MECLTSEQMENSLMVVILLVSQTKALHKKQMDWYQYFVMSLKKQTVNSSLTGLASTVDTSELWSMYKVYSGQENPF